MAGFKKGEPYRLERGLVVLQHSLDWYERKLFGNKIATFRAEAAARVGDKSTCCSNFLNDIIPWFVEVLVQDGIYFIVDFPDHNVSRWLRVRIEIVNEFRIFCMPILYCATILTILLIICLHLGQYPWL
jgi:hypothetical protein